MAMSFQCVFTVLCWNPYRRDPPGAAGRGLVRRGLGDGNVVSPIDALRGAVPPHLARDADAPASADGIPDRVEVLSPGTGVWRPCLVVRRRQPGAAPPDGTGAPPAARAAQVLVHYEARATLSRRPSQDTVPCWGLHD